eukprot:TRINITY_DN25768_c0_g1_i1.p1 TRINITY_DN25768_c0_g1~~TRINITY_DN25768_c0_g1_i1.p1  ORF type:complete len:461 (+),score=159.29 TRINITY_DN25768_c0_g1_i1:54-1436(+)
MRVHVLGIAAAVAAQCPDGLYLPDEGCRLQQDECDVEVCQRRGTCVAAPRQLSTNGVLCGCGCGWGGVWCGVCLTQSCPPNCTAAAAPQISPTGSPTSAAVVTSATLPPTAVARNAATPGGVLVVVAISAVGVIILACAIICLRLFLAAHGRRHEDRGDPGVHPTTWFVPRREVKPKLGDTVRLRQDAPKWAPQRCLSLTVHQGVVTGEVEVDDWEKVVEPTNRWRWQLGLRVVPTGLTGSAAICNGQLGRVVQTITDEHDSGSVSVKFPERVFGAPVQIRKQQLQRVSEKVAVPGFVVRGPKRVSSIFRQTEVELVPRKRMLRGESDDDESGPEDGDDGDADAPAPAPTQKQKSVKEEVEDELARARKAAGLRGPKNPLDVDDDLRRERERKTSLAPARLSVCQRELIAPGSQREGAATAASAQRRSVRRTSLTEQLRSRDSTASAQPKQERRQSLTGV